ncbi:hypothetical protein WDW86_17910 [Bdellovibrionota bacterium FG-2]
MNEKKNKAKLLEIKEAMKNFPKEVRRQERAHREDMKVQKAFGTLSLKPEKSNKSPRQGF